MITRQDIENEAAFVQHLIELTNPTGRLHSATPWIAGGDDTITAAGAVIAKFYETGDRDVALYFANTHAAIIGMLRGEAEAWDFARESSTDAGFKSYMQARADNLRIYADLFCRLGKPDPIPEPQGSA